jgi:hypothetical protein
LLSSLSSEHQEKSEYGSRLGCVHVSHLLAVTGLPANGRTAKPWLVAIVG